MTLMAVQMHSDTENEVTLRHSYLLLFLATSQYKINTTVCRFVILIPLRQSTHIYPMLFKG